LKFIKFVAVVLGFSLLFQGVTPSHAAANSEGLYIYWANTQKYVGESKNVTSRLGTHDKVLLKEGNKINSEKLYLMPGSTSSTRRKAEQEILTLLGGKKQTKMGLTVRNKINAVQQGGR
jgi:uncharacterized protein involved in copper resistance